MGTHKHYGSIPAADIAQSAWAAYTPTWGGGSALGNGTMVAAYGRVGNTVHFRVQITLGSTSSLTASTQTLTLPVAAKAGTFPVFGGEAFDTSAGGAVQVRTNATSSTVMALLVPAVETGAYDRVLNSSAPFPWATGDRIFVSGTYECA